MHTNERTSQETCIISVFKLLRSQNASKQEHHSIYRNRTFPKTCVLSVFHIVMYQIAKINAKHPLWTKKKKKTFSETYLLTDYGHLRHQNAFWKIKQDKQKGVLGVFQILTYQNTNSRTKHALWKTRTLPKKRIFECFF